MPKSPNRLFRKSRVEGIPPAKRLYLPIFGKFPKKILQKFFKKLLTPGGSPAILPLARLRDLPYGGIAQLGERLNGIQEVSGSIPLISTIRQIDRRVPMGV